MRKYLLLALIQLCALQTLMADDLNSAQLKLRSDIQTFLKEEGFMPEIDSDGDIKFKKEGFTYYVSVSSNDESPMYITLFCPFSYPDDITRETLFMASAELNKYKGVKVMCYDKSYNIQCNMYLTTAEPFKYAFYKMMSQIASAKDDVRDECEKVGTVGHGGGSSAVSGLIPFIITSMKVGITDYDGNTITSYGNTLYSSKTRYLKPQITLTPLRGSGTYQVYIKMYKAGSLTTGSSSPSGYSYSDNVSVTGSSSQTVSLQGWGSNTSGHWSAGAYRFEVWYGDYCIGSKSFTVY